VVPSLIPVSSWWGNNDGTRIFWVVPPERRAEIVANGRMWDMRAALRDAGRNPVVRIMRMP